MSPQTTKHSIAKLRRAIDDDIPDASLLRPCLSIVDLEQPRNANFVVARMPADVGVFDELWTLIEATCKRLRVPIKRAPKLHNVGDLGYIFGSIEWLWERWLPKGYLTLLVGEPGDGKSMVALDWIGRVTQRVPFYNEPTTAPRLSTARPNTVCAVWVETESSQQLLFVRVRSMALPEQRIILPSFGNDLLDQPDLMDNAHQAKLTKLVSDTKPDIVVVDSLGGAHTRGENKIEEVRPMLDYLSKLARDAGTCVVAVHHLRKPNMGDPIEVSMERIRGSTAFSAFARSIIAIERIHGNDNSRKVRVIKSNLSRIPPVLNAELVFDGDDIRQVKYTEFTPPAPKRTKRERCADWVFGVLTRNGRTSLHELCTTGSGEGFTRAMMYEARDIIGDALTVTGTGREVFWEITTNPLAAMQAPQLEEATQ